MAANEAYVGRNVGLKETGLTGLKKALGSEAASFGATSGLLELATGGSKVKAVMESIKWGAYAAAGVAGFKLVADGVLGLTVGLRKAVNESGILQAALQRLGETKALTGQFTSFLGSVELAKKRVAELFAFTASSKFNFGEVTNASRVLTIFSQGTQGGVKDLQMLGRIATATGNDLQELSMAYGRLTEQARNGTDISDTTSELQHMGVISEATAHRLLFLQQAGESGNTILKEFQSTIKATSAAMGDGGQSVAELEDQIDKLKTGAAAAFGKPWMEDQTNELKRQIVFWNAITPAAAKFGEALEFTTKPANILKNAMADVEKTDAFKNTLGTLAQMAAFLPGVIASYFTIKGLASGAAGKMFTGIPKVFTATVKIIKSAAPSVAERELLTLGGRLAESAAKMSGPAKVATEALSKAAMGGAGAMAQLGKAVAWVGTRLVPFAAGAVIIGVAAYAAAKAWDAWRDSLQRAGHAAELAKEALGARSGIDKQIADLKTMEDRTRLLTKARQELNDALREQISVAQDANSSESEKATAAELVTERRRALRKVEGAETGGLGATSKTLEQKTAQLRIEKEIADIVFQAEFSRASAGKQAIMLSERLRDNTKLIAEYQKQEAQAPAIADLDAKISEGAEQRGLEARKLGAEYNNLIAKAQKLQEAIAEGSSRQAAHPEERINLQEELATTQDQANQVRAQLRGLREPSREERAATIERTKLRSGPEAAQFDRLQEEAGKARKGGRGALADQLELESIKLQMKTKADAEKEAAEEAQQLEDMRRQGSLRKAELDEHEKLLGITEETYEAQDEAARIQMQTVERQRALLVDIPEGTGNKDAQKARENQIRGFEQQTAELQRGIDERARARVREQQAFSSASQIRTLENTALVEATKGHFAEADAALKSAQQIEDQQSDRERAFQLQQQGMKKEEIATRVAAESKLRQSDREAKAAAFRESEGRRIKELQLEAVSVGGGKALGLTGTGPEAREQLQKMQDVDLFREELSKNVEALGPGHAEEAAKMALQSSQAQIAIQGTNPPGTGSIGDSLTRVGGGGGFYAGAGDASLTIQKRMSSLQEEMVRQLTRMNEKKVVVK